MKDNNKNDEGRTEKIIFCVLVRARVGVKERERRERGTLSLQNLKYFIGSQPCQ